MKRRAFLRLAPGQVGLDTQPVEHGQHQPIGRAPVDSLDDGASLDQQSFGLCHGLHGDDAAPGRQLWDPRTDDDVQCEPLTVLESLEVWGLLAVSLVLWGWLIVSAWRWVMG